MQGKLANARACPIFYAKSQFFEKIFYKMKQLSQQIPAYV